MYTFYSKMYHELAQSSQTGIYQVLFMYNLRKLSEYRQFGINLINSIYNSAIIP